MPQPQQAPVELHMRLLVAAALVELEQACFLPQVYQHHLLQLRQDLAEHHHL
jgi:hypothetical protein